MQLDPAVLNRWGGAAQYWDKHRETLRRMFAPVTQALAGDAAIGTRDTLLDIATGPGEPALSLAALVGPEGKIFGIDMVPEMVAAARGAAERFGIRNAQFDVGSADHLPFPESSLDAIVSRFGIMFFPSPVDAVREMLRVLRPGRKFALAVWDSADTNPYFHAISGAFEPYADAPPPEPQSLDAFRFAAPGKLRDILAEAGASAPYERQLRFTAQAPISAEEFWTMRCEMSEKLREKVATLSPAQLADVKAQALQSLREYSTETGISFPTQVWIVSGTK